MNENENDSVTEKDKVIDYLEQCIPYAVSLFQAVQYLTPLIILPR